jgi:hypothetical protein
MQAGVCSSGCTTLKMHPLLQVTLHYAAFTGPHVLPLAASKCSSIVAASYASKHSTLCHTAVNAGRASANKSSSVNLVEVDPSLAPSASAVGGTSLYGNNDTTDPLLADSTLTSAGDEFMVRLA